MKYYYDNLSKAEVLTILYNAADNTKEHQKFLKEHGISHDEMSLTRAEYAIGKGVTDFGKVNGKKIGINLADDTCFDTERYDHNNSARAEQLLNVAKRAKIIRENENKSGNDRSATKSTERTK